MKKIIFDVDGVLIDGYHYRPELRKCWHKNLNEDFGIDPEYFSNTFFLDPFSSKVLPGDIDLKEALSEWLPSVGYTGKIETFIQYWLKNDSTLNPALMHKIKALKKSGLTQLYIATNQAHIRAHYLMDTLGLAEYFDDIFYSAKIRSMKPSTEYFDYIIKSLNLTSENPPIIFDDTPDVIEFTKSIGWESYEFINADTLHECPYVDKILKNELA